MKALFFLLVFIGADINAMNTIGSSSGSSNGGSGKKHGRMKRAVSALIKRGSTKGGRPSSISASLEYLPPLQQSSPSSSPGTSSEPLDPPMPRNDFEKVVTFLVAHLEGVENRQEGLELENARLKARGVRVACGVGCMVFVICQMYYLLYNAGCDCTGLVYIDNPNLE